NDDQDLPETMPGLARGRAGSGLKSRENVFAARERGNGSEEKTGEDRDAEGEEENRHVDADLVGAGRKPCGERDQQTKPGRREQEAQHSSEKTEDRALGEHLPQEPPAARAQGRAHGELPAAA